VPERRVRIGDFLMDFGRFQLLEGGRPVQLEGLPLQLLMFLIEKPGELVTREQIAAVLWGKDVFVDVEQGINTAIRKIRRALRDDVGQPRYLQTVVGRGYRLVAEVRSESDAGGIRPSANPELRVSAEELGRAIMTAAGLDAEKPQGPPKNPPES